MLQTEIFLYTLFASCSPLSHVCKWSMARRINFLPFLVALLPFLLSVESDTEDHWIFVYQPPKYTVAGIIYQCMQPTEQNFVQRDRLVPSHNTKIRKNSRNKSRRTKTLLILFKTFDKKANDCYIVIDFDLFTSSSWWQDGQRTLTTQLPVVSLTSRVTPLLLNKQS